MEHLKQFMEAHSFEQLRAILWQVLLRQIASFQDIESISLDASSVVYSDGGKLWQVSFDVTPKNEVILTSTPEQVEMVPQKLMTEAVDFIDDNSKDKAGSKWRVKLISAGLSNNGFLYSETLLRNSVSMFEGIRCLERSDEKHLEDQDKNTKNLVGFFNNVSWSDENNAIIADFNIAESRKQLKIDLAWAFREGKENFIGLSIVAIGTARPERKNGRLIHVAESFEQIKTVDLVVNPSAGGGFIDMIEADNKKEKTMNLQDILKLLDIDRIKYSTNITEAEAKDLLFLSRNRKADNDQAEMKKFLEGFKKESENLFSTVKAQKTELQKQKCQDFFTSQMVEAKMTEAEKGLLGRFDNSVFTEAELITEIDNIKKLRAEKDDSGKVSSPAIVGDMMTEADTLGNALDGFFIGANVNKVPRFKSFRKAFVDITGDVDVSFQKSKAPRLQKLIEANQVSTLTQVFGDSITRVMLADYRRPDLQNWRSIVTVGSASDFRTNRYVRIGGYDTVPIVAEKGVYQDLGVLSDEEATSQVQKRGGTAAITREMIINDDIRAIGRLPVLLSRAAGKTLRSDVFGLLTDNPVATYDSVAHFHATHNNLNTVALSEASLHVNRRGLYNQQAFGSTNDQLNTEMKRIIYPVDLELVVNSLVGSPARPGTSNAEPNLFNSFGVQKVIIPNSTDTNNFYTMADPADVEGLRVDFLNGMEEPDLLIQDQPTSGSMFTADVVTYKVVLMYGTTIVDHRATQGNIVA